MMKRFFLLLIRFYRRGISPYTPPSCKFTPTCSAYAQEAIERYGALRGGWLTFKRHSKCHPLCRKFGYDPVPDLIPKKFKKPLDKRHDR